MFLKFLADADAGRIITAPYGRDVVEQTAKLVRLAFGRRRPPAIRTLDAIHVASALAIKAKALVSTDSRLREVAAAAGLKLVPLPPPARPAYPFCAAVAIAFQTFSAVMRTVRSALLSFGKIVAAPSGVPIFPIPMMAAHCQCSSGRSSAIL